MQPQLDTGRTEDQQGTHSTELVWVQGFFICIYCTVRAHRAGSDGSMSTPGSAGLEFDPRRDSKFSFENFQPRG